MDWQSIEIPGGVRAARHALNPPPSHFCATGTPFCMAGTHFGMGGTHFRMTGAHLYVVGTHLCMVGTHFRTTGTHFCMTGPLNLYGLAVHRDSWGGSGRRGMP